MSIRQRTSLIAVLCWAGTAKAPAASSWLEQFANSGGIGGVIDTGLSGHTAVYDAATNTMIAFGASDASLSFATTNAVILLNPANGMNGTSNWTTLVANGAAGSPASRAFHSAVYDPANNRMMVFGGATYANGHSDPSAYLNDVWVLENANGQGGASAWSELSPGGTAPAPRMDKRRFLTPPTTGW